MNRTRPPATHALRSIVKVWLCAAALVSASTIGEAQMYDNSARPAAEVAAHEPFPDDIAAVEQAWEEPIPDRLQRIGGVDWWSWAYVEITVEDQTPVFIGEYRDRLQRYRGTFRYRHPQNAPMPAHPFADYVMSHLSEDAIVFIKDDDSVPRDYFMLEPTDPDLIERR